MKGLNIKDKNKLRQNGIFAMLMIFTAGFLFWRCQFGITSVDEGLYLTIPYRLSMGDGLFGHEWHLSQMSGLLMLPQVWLYLKLTGGTEGLVLFMRCFTILIQCLIGVLAYIRLRRYHYPGAVAGSICFALYIPFAISQLSYNSMGIMALVLCGILLLPGQKERRSFYVLAGLSFAAAVLCCPYLLIVYVVYLLAVAVAMLRRKTAGLSLFTLKGALWFTAGAAAAALVFGIFVLSRSSMGELITAFRYILDDPEHPSVGIWKKTVTYLEGIVCFSRGTRWLYPCLGVLFAACTLDRKRKAHGLLYFCGAAVLTSVLMFILFRKLRYINYVMWGLNMMTPFLMLLSDRKELRRIFTCLWVPGMLYSYCIHLSANQVFVTSASASTVATVGTLVMLGIYCSELWQQHSAVSLRVLSTATAAVLLLMQLLPLGYLRYRYIFGDQQGIEQQTVTITEGLQKGLKVSKGLYDYYNTSGQLLDTIGQYEPEKVLFLTESTWYYLEGEYEMATYSAWLSGPGEHTLYRLRGYYELNPEKLPDLIYIGPDYEKTGVQLARGYGFEATENPRIWVRKK